MPLIVFDFDKTLTRKDTLYGFYKIIDQENPFFPLKRLVLIIAAMLYKLRFIDNTQLKKAGIFLFLRNKTLKEAQKKAKTYASKVQLNNIYSDFYLSTPKENRMIISASFEIYLKVIFPQETTIGSCLRFSDGKISGLEQNMYGKQKAEALKKLGIYKINTLYTDSYSDKPLMKMADQVKLINNGQVTTRI